jgi:hypothetical protein
MMKLSESQPTIAVATIIAIDSQESIELVKKIL